MKRIILLSVVYLLIVMNEITGQPVDPLNNAIVPPSPTAAALARYGQVPVSLSSGIPEITIPLFEIKDHELYLPVTLSYHASGIKVEEIASWVGLGWSLNAGGVVTRNVMGLPDEYL